MKNEGLKLIGIKPLSNCNTNFLKILRAGTIYYFYQGYNVESFTDTNEERINIHDNLPEDLYSDDTLKINISAIVGKNGAGKSSLLELLFAGLYNLSRELKMFSKSNDNGHINDIKFELFFSLEGLYYKMIFGEHSSIFEFNDNCIGYKDVILINKRVKLAQLFYTIVINYSQYALNSNEIGSWIVPIFHKNDAYQIPIVLNPYRDEGNIDINIENYLVKSRLLSIILGYYGDNVKGNQVILNNRIPENLSLEIDWGKFKKKKNGDIHLEALSLQKRIMPDVYHVFFNDRDFKPVSNYLNELAIDYIIRKLKSIISKYKHYSLYNNFDARKGNSQLTKYLSALNKDHSHVTFKLRQALNFLRFDLLPKDKVEFKITNLALSKRIRELATSNQDIKLIELIPPSFFKIDIDFSGDENSFNKLSSGEKQRIYSLSSLIYHLKNIDSAHENPNTGSTTKSRALIQYEYVNIIFDEIELYYHPEFQQSFIQDILMVIRSANLKFIKGINFIFVTHSPFILSDIPKDAIMYLKLDNDTSVQQLSSGKSSFAANIHDLLATSFFLSGGLMGKFASEKVMEVINWCNTKGFKEKAEYYRQLIELIDEPIIKVKLSEMFADKMGENIEMARLKAQRDYIEKRMNEIDIQ